VQQTTRFGYFQGPSGTLADFQILYWEVDLFPHGPPSTPTCWKGRQAMRARPEVRDGLIAFKIKRWKTIAHNPSAFGGYSVSQARKNYWRLCARYP